MRDSVFGIPRGRAGLALLLALVFGSVLSGCATAPAHPFEQTQTPVLGTAVPAELTAGVTFTAVPYSPTAQPENTVPSGTGDGPLDLAYPGAEVVPVGADFFQSPEPDKTRPAPNGTVSVVFASTASYARLAAYYTQLLTTQHYRPTGDSTVNHSDPTFTILTHTNGRCLVHISLWSPARLHMDSHTLPPGYAPVVARLSPTQTLIVTSRVPQQASAVC